MKIIAINGSPHKGNTSDKIMEIEQKLKKYNEVEFEIINLKDVNFKHCKGCFLCFIKGDDSCPIKDDKEKIFKKMDEAAAYC